jgi:hypothetical protein
MEFNHRDWGTKVSDYDREHGKRPKGGLVHCGVYSDKRTRDDMAEDHRAMRKSFGDGRVVQTGERTIRFDNVAITTYLLTVRQPAAA